MPHPTVGARPLRSTLAAVASASTRRPADAGTPSTSAPVAAVWTPAPTLPAVVTNVAHDATSIAPQGGPAIPTAPATPVARSSPVDHGLSPTGDGATAAHWLVPAVAPSIQVQRSAAVEGRQAKGDIDLSLARPRPALFAATRGAPAVAWSAGAAPTSATPGIVSAPAQPSVQTSTATAPTMTAVTATPVIQRVDGAAPASPSHGEAHSEAELDELARSLFGRIRNHLRTDVLNDREANGIPFDAF